VRNATFRRAKSFVRRRPEPTEQSSLIPEMLAHHHENQIATVRTLINELHAGTYSLSPERVSEGATFIAAARMRRERLQADREADQLVIDRVSAAGRAEMNAFIDAYEATIDTHPALPFPASEVEAPNA